MYAFAILLAVTGLTIVGDYCIKQASAQDNGLSTAVFLCGAVLYGLTSVGWFYLMRSHSLTTIAIFYSASIIILLAALGYFVFKEQFGMREVIGIALAIASVVVMSHDS